MLSRVEGGVEFCHGIGADCICLSLTCSDHFARHNRLKTGARALMNAVEACAISSDGDGASWATSFVVVFALFILADLLFATYTISAVVRKSGRKGL